MKFKELTLNNEFCIEYLRNMATVFGKNCTQVR